MGLYISLIIFLKIYYELIFEDKQIEKRTDIGWKRKKWCLVEFQKQATIRLNYILILDQLITRKIDNFSDFSLTVKKNIKSKENAFGVEHI